MAHAGTVTGKRVDPLSTRKYFVQIGSILEAEFSDVSGLNAEVEVFPYEEGGVNGFVHKLPGRMKFPNITLKRGVTDSLELWNWFVKATNGQIERRDVGILVYDLVGKPVKVWNLERAYPVKWTGPDFKAGDNAVAIETLELAHEGLSSEKST